MMRIPERTQPTKYKKPARFNIITATLLVIVLAAGYVLYSTWPVVALRLRVKDEMEDVLPHLWRANLRDERMMQSEIAKMKKDLLTVRLPKAGVKDKKAEVIFERSKKRVAIQAKFTARAVFPGLDKEHVFQLAPRVETDAARVDW
jgi:hypothetical protein